MVYETSIRTVTMQGMGFCISQLDADLLHHVQKTTPDAEEKLLLGVEGFYREVQRVKEQHIHQGGTSEHSHERCE